MKFQDLVLLIEQDTAQGNWYAPPGTDEVPTPNFGTLQPGDGTPEETIANVLNHLINPVQVAIDAYELGNSIYDAYNKFKDDPTAGNALGLLVAGSLGVVSIAPGGKASKAAVAEAERIMAAKEMVAAAKTEVEQVRALASLMHYMEGIKDTFSGVKIDNITKSLGMTAEQAEEIKTALKGAIPEAEAGLKDAEKAIKDTNLKSSYEAAVDRIEKKLPVTASQTINWETEPWLSKTEDLARDLNRIAKTSNERGKALGEFLKDLEANPEVANIAKKNGLTPEQMNSFIDYSYGGKPVSTPVATPGAGSIPLPTPAPTPVPAAIPAATSAKKYRPTTPAQRAKNTELYKTVTKAKAGIPAPVMTPGEQTILSYLKSKPTSSGNNVASTTAIGLTIQTFKWLGSLTKDQYNKIDPETKTLIASFVLGLPSAAIGLGAGYNAANSEPGRQLKAFLSTPVGEIFKPSLQQQLKTLTDKRNKLAQSLGSAGWRPEQVKRLTASLDSQINNLQSQLR